MKIYFLFPIILLSFLNNAFAKESSSFLKIFISKIDTNLVNNNFENGVSPTTYRYFFPEVSQSGYNMMIFRTEGMDGINYFGNRLKDVSLDGKIDIIQRVKEHLSGDWDLPSTEPRVFIRNQIDKDFNSKLLIDSLLYFGGEDHKYFEDASGEYFYNFSWFDPTLDQEIGINDWKGFFKKNGLIENIDYAVGNVGPNQLRIEFMPRLYLKKNGKIKDITSTNLIFSDEILATRARFPWDQSLGVGDFNGDGYKDVLMTGIHASTSELSGLPELYQRQRTAFYFFRNDGSGKLYGEILDFIVDGGFNWQVPEGSNQYATQMDADASLELLSELWVDTVGDQNSISIRKFGYFNVNVRDKKVEFIPLFNGEDYLLDTKWNIFPKVFLPMGFLDPQRELVLYLFTSPSGSPAKEFTGVNTDNTTGSDFTKGVVQQYFRMYEKVKQGNTFKLIDVTSEYFLDGEDKTLSLDNSGTIHLIDVDNDGKLDIYPQLGGTTPNKVMGGINQFLNYPSWNGKTNTLYYFKQTDDKKFKLTDLAEIRGYYYPNNLENGYSVFDDNDSHKNGDQNINLGNFTIFNNASLNDLDGDGKFEIITAGNPDFLNVFTKSKLQLDKFKNLSIAPNLKISLRKNGDVINTYDFSNLKFSSDTLLKFLDESLRQQFVITDSLQKMTHNPNFLEAYPKKSTYYILPYLILSDKLSQNEGSEVALGEGRWSLLGKEGDLDYSGAYYVRIDNDFEIKSKNFFLSNKNLAPLPFQELSSKALETSNSKGFEIEVTN